MSAANTGCVCLRSVQSELWRPRWVWHLGYLVWHLCYFVQRLAHFHDWLVHATTFISPLKSSNGLLFRFQSNGCAIREPTCHILGKSKLYAVGRTEGSRSLELIGGVLLLVGLGGRCLGLLYVGEFLVVTFYVLVPTRGWFDSRLSIMLLAGALMLVVAGSGKASLDGVLWKRRYVESR